MKNNRDQKGVALIGWIIIIIVLVLLLSYFGINLRGIVESDTGQSNFGYLQTVILGLWNGYLATPLSYFWNSAIEPLWGLFLQSLDNLKNGLN